MVTVRIRQTGPIFAGRNAQTITRHLEASIHELVELGEGQLAKMLRPRPAGVFLAVSQARRGRGSVGHYRRNVSTRFQHLAARISDGGVIYGPWLEGVSSRNARTRFEGYASFRRTGQWLQRQADRVFRKHVVRLARSLGGR
jgi:hypothetical protein